MGWVCIFLLACCVWCMRACRAGSIFLSIHLSSICRPSVVHLPACLPFRLSIRLIFIGNGGHIWNHIRPLSAFFGSSSSSLSSSLSSSSSSSVLILILIIVHLELFCSSFSLTSASDVCHHPSHLSWGTHDWWFPMPHLISHQICLHICSVNIS